MKFHLEDDSLTIIFEGVEQLWAFRRKLTIPKLDITHAVWQEGVSIPRRELGWRIGGTALPGILFAGRFMGFEGRNFVYLQRPRGMFGDVQVAHALTLEVKNCPYKRFILTIDKPDIAQSIITWWSGNV